mgnify:CR=1 FL=1
MQARTAGRNGTGRPLLTMRLAILGNSHAACLMTAVRDVPGVTGHIEPVFFASVAQNMGALRLNRDGVFVPRDETLKQQITRSSGGVGKIDPAAYDAYRDWGAPMARAMAAGDWTEAARRFTASWGTGQGWEDLTEAQRAQYTRQMPLIAATQPALLDDSRILLRPGGLEALQMPVLMLRGAKSMPIMGPIHTALFARIPQSRDVEIPGAGHMVPISHPSAVAAEIGPFLDAA